MTSKTSTFLGDADRDVIEILSVKHNLIASAPPKNTDDKSKGYSIRSLWIDKLTHNAYLCSSSTVGEAVWIEMGAGGQSSTGSNVGTGKQLFKDKVGATMRFRSIKSSDTISAVQDGDEIKLDVKPTLNATTISSGSVDNAEFDTLIGATSSIQAQLDAITARLGSTIRHNVTTTTGSWTQLVTITTTVDTVYQVEVRIVAMRTDTNGEGSSYILTGTYRRDGGNVILIASDKLELEDSLPWDVELSNAGTNIVVNVKGEAGKTLAWAAEVKTLHT